MVMPWELSILDGAHALLLRAKLAITGNTTITGDLDVSGAITGGTIPIENLSNVDKQSFKNLIDNGDFKLWSGGVTSPPDEWIINQSTIAQDGTNKQIGSYGVALTSNGTYCNLRQNLSDYSRYAGRKITLGVWCKALSTNTKNSKITIHDGVSESQSSTFVKDDAWHWITVTRTVADTPTQLRLHVYGNISGESDTDDIIYFDGAMLVEGSICPAFSPMPLSDPHTYGEMYIYNNSNATVIETANTPIALRQISGGLQKGFIFDAGETGGVISYSDYSGTVAGTVRVFVTGTHTLQTGDIITIRGSTNYNGIHQITVITNEYFYFTDPWAGDDGASDWDKGASLTAQAGAAGEYTSTWQMTTAPAGACELCFKVNINETPQDKSTACRDMAINDKDNNSSTCLLTIAENDVIWLSVESDSTSDITNSMGNINLERVS